MKTLKRDQIKTIKLFLNDVVSCIDEDACPCLIDVSYDFRKNRYKLCAKFLMTVISCNEFDPETPWIKLIGEFEFSRQASYDDTMVQTNVKSLFFMHYDSPNEIVTDKNIIQHIVLPFKSQKGGVVLCVEGEGVEAEGVEAVESMSGCPEAESECSKYFPCNDSPFSNASLD